MESYIVINGKKAPLTEEQLKMLGLTTEKENPFKRVKNGRYCFINPRGEADIDCDDGVETDDSRYKAANYCTDENLLQQRAWHETLNRLLWRYSMEHKADRKDDKVWSITYNADAKEFRCGWVNYKILFIAEIAFDTEEIGNNAIKEIVEPFMKEHPDFVW